MKQIYKNKMPATVAQELEIVRIAVQGQPGQNIS
jgi:hypothetical protein